MPSEATILETRVFSEARRSRRRKGSAICDASVGALEFDGLKTLSLMLCCELGRRIAARVVLGQKVEEQTLTDGRSWFTMAREIG